MVQGLNQNNPKDSYCPSPADFAVSIKEILMENGKETSMTRIRLENGGMIHGIGFHSLRSTLVLYRLKTLKMTSFHCWIFRIDSYLMPDVCKTVAVRLRQLIRNWPDDDIDKINALYLAEGMELAHQQNEPLGFI